MSQNTAAKKKDSVWSPAVVAVAIICAVVLIATVALAIVASTGYFRRNTVVMEVGDHKINQIEYEYYYAAQYQNWYYYVYSINIKTTICYIDSTVTWHEYFVREAKEAIVNDYVMSDKATELGFTLTEASQKTLADLPTTLTADAESYDMTVDEYLSTIYCKNMTLDLYMEYVSRNQLAADFAEDYYNNTLKSEFTTDEAVEAAINKYYEENKKDFDIVEYYFYDIVATSGKTITDIKAEFEGLSGEDLEQLFKDKIKELNPDKVEEGKEFSYTNYHKEDVSYSDTDEFSKWLFDAEKIADKSIAIYTTPASGSTAEKYTAVYMVYRGKDMSKVATMRHILFQALEKLDADGNVVKDEKGNAVLDMDAAKAEAEKILAEFNSGDKSEDAFIAFVEANTDDAASKYTGGLYEDFNEGYMTEGIDEWIFPADDEKQPAVGDVANLKSEYGYHLVYFLGYKDAWHVEVENTMKQERYDAAKEEWTKAATIVYHEDVLAKIG